MSGPCWRAFESLNIATPCALFFLLFRSLYLLSPVSHHLAVSYTTPLDEPPYGDDDGRGPGSRRPVRRERDDVVHDSIIEERIQRERPCRTLFIRNIKASQILLALLFVVLLEIGQLI